MKARRAAAAGYILVETLVAMGILSIGMAVIQRSIREAIVSRGQAMDYTTARFILEECLAWRELESYLAASSGVFPTKNPRFQCQWEVTEIEIPQPEIPPGVPPELLDAAMKTFSRNMGRITVTVTWSRAGRDFEVTGQTLVGTSKMWPPEHAADALQLLPGG